MQMSEAIDVKLKEQAIFILSAYKKRVGIFNVSLTGAVNELLKNGIGFYDTKTQNVIDKSDNKV